MAMKKSWEQIENESAKAFEAFSEYRDMGLGRNLRGLSLKVGKAFSLLSRWSGEYDWQARCKAWDKRLDQEKCKRQIDKIRNMKIRQINLALRAQELADLGIKSMIEKWRDAQEEGDKKISNGTRIESLAKLLDTGCRLERLNRDEPEQNLELMQQQNFDNLSLEEMETFRALLSKANGVL
jgi:hypothetical protein